MQIHTFEMSATQAEMIHTQIASHCSALKNWIVTAVENGELSRAKELAAELRAHQTLFALFNMKAKAESAARSGEPMATRHSAR